MTTRLVRHANSLVLVIDQELLDLLNIHEDTPFSIKVDGSSLVITPVEDPDRQEKFRETLEEAHRRYGSAFKKLAE